jgi:transcriptional regulator with XRE-family HTH domain
MNNSRDEKRLRAFGLHLRSLRKAKNLTMKDLAFEADIELSQIHRIEKGKTNPTLSTIILIAEALGEPAARLFEFKY